MKAERVSDKYLTAAWTESSQILRGILQKGSTTADPHLERNNTGRQVYLAVSMVKRLLAFLSFAALLPFTFGVDDSITLTNGQSFTGTIRGIEAGFLAIEIAADHGTAIRRFRPNDIQTLAFSDNTLLQQYSELSESQLHEKIAWMEPIANRRTPFIGLLSESDELALIILCELLTESGQSKKALEYAKIWHPHLSHESHSIRISNTLILAALNSQELSEAEVHAKTFLRTEKGQHSALAWHALALAHLKRGETEEALWKSLIPIANYQSPASPHLARCYESAISACINLERYSQARVLQLEMSELFPGHLDKIQIPNTETDKLKPPDSILTEPIQFEKLLKFNLN